jgi:hypothetical protein
MHANDIFSFFKNYFWHQYIKIIQNIQIILNFSKKKLNFLGTQPQPRSQTFPYKLNKMGAKWTKSTRWARNEPNQSDVFLDTRQEEVRSPLGNWEEPNFVHSYPLIFFKRLQFRGLRIRLRSRDELLTVAFKWRQLQTNCNDSVMVTWPSFSSLVLRFIIYQNMQCDLCVNYKGRGHYNN